MTPATRVKMVMVTRVSVRNNVGTSAGAIAPSPRGGQCPDHHANGRRDEGLQDHADPQLAVGRSQGFQGGEQFALLEDDQGEEQCHDQCRNGQRCVDDRVEGGVLLLDAGDGQAGVFGTQHRQIADLGLDLFGSHAGVGDHSYRIHVVGHAGELRADLVAHRSPGVDRGPHRRLKLVGRVAHDTYDFDRCAAHADRVAEGDALVDQTLVHRRGTVLAGFRQTPFGHRGRHARTLRVDSEDRDVVLSVGGLTGGQQHAHTCGLRDARGIAHLVHLRGDMLERINEPWRRG